MKTNPRPSVAPFLTTLCLAAGFLSVAWSAEVSVTVVNGLDLARPSETISLPWPGLVAALSQAQADRLQVRDKASGKEVPCQAVDSDANGTPDEFIFQADFGPKETRAFVLATLEGPATRFPSRAFGRFVPERKDDFAWENDRIAHRMYGAALETDRMTAGLYGIYAPTGFTPSLQWDVYGKRPDAWRLSLDELESVNYHADNPVAVDYLLVANSMGLGGPTIGSGRPVAVTNGDYTYRVLCNGPVRAGLEVRVTGWGTPEGGRYDGTIGYLVYAGHDFIDATFAVTERQPSGEAFGLGARRIPHVEAFVGDAKAGVLGVMGRQEGIVEKTGLAVLFEPERFLRWGVEEEPTDAYIVYLTPSDEGGADVYRARLVGIWSEGGIATEHTMPRHLLDLAARMNEPVEVSR